MTAISEPLPLAADFPAATRHDWQLLVAATLRKSGVDVAKFGDNPQDAIASVTADGIVIGPLYTAADPGTGAMPRQVTTSVAPTLIGWDVRQRHADPDPAVTKKAIADDLQNGVTSLWLAVGGAGISVADLPSVLDGVGLQFAPVVLDAGADAAQAAAAYLDLLSAQAADPAATSANLGADPIGWAARSGAEIDLSLIGQLRSSAADYPLVRSVTVDATVYHDAGGVDSDELAIAASVAVAYLRELTAAGLDIAGALAEIDFRYAVTADQFGSIAKLRAARGLWNRIAELAGAAPQARGQRQHAVTSAAMMTKRDPWVNMLRTTIGCFAAAVGGAQAVTVAPFDAAVGLPDDFARRIARNTQSVLQDESSLARVIDPANGSWYVESLTRQLAEAAWAKFTALERGGGAVAAWQSGAIAELLAASRERKQDRIRRRLDPITGVSEFPPAAEVPLQRRPAAAGPAGGLPTLRNAEVFEQLRDRADQRTGSPVFLAAFGPAQAHTGRLGFARNLCEIAGLDVVVGVGGADANGIADLVGAFTASGATIACLCSSNASYADLATSVAQALKDAGARRVWVAGPPSLVAGPIDAAIYQGCDAVTVLDDMVDSLESLDGEAVSR